MQWLKSLSGRAQVLLMLGVVLLLVVGGWGIGWLAHTLRSTPAESLPTATAVPPSSPPTVETGGTTVAPPPTARPVSSPLPPTSTPAPTFTPAPPAVPATETVQAGDRGLYDVCRRHCPALRYDGAALIQYAHRVAEVNGLDWGADGPSLNPGDVLTMPPCP